MTQPEASVRSVLDPRDLVNEQGDYVIPGILGCDFATAPRVSKVLQMIGGRWGLEQWMKKTVAEAAVDWAESGRFSTVLGQGREVLVKALMAAPDEQRDSAGDSGTLVHDAIEAWARGQQPPVTVGPQGDALAHAIALLEQVEFEPLHIEAAVYGGLADEETAYGGRLDYIGRLTLPDGRRVTALVDIKTSKSLRSSFAYQLAAYRYSDWMLGDGGQPVKTPEVDGAFIVHVRPEKARLVPIDASEAAYGAFMAARYLLAAGGRRFVYRAVNLNGK